MTRSSVLRVRSKMKHKASLWLFIIALCTLGIALIVQYNIDYDTGFGLWIFGGVLIASSITMFFAEVNQEKRKKDQEQRNGQTKEN